MHTFLAFHGHGYVSLWNDNIWKFNLTFFYHCQVGHESCQSIFKEKIDKCINEVRQGDEQDDLF